MELEAFGVGVAIGVVGLVIVVAVCKWIGRINGLLDAEAYRKITDERRQKALDNNRSDFWALSRRVDAVESVVAKRVPRGKDDQ